MNELITYIDEELNSFKTTFDNILELEDSHWDHENTYEWIIGWSNLVKEFINIRREHFGGKGNLMNPISISVTNQLGYVIKVKSPIVNVITNKLVSALDNEVFIGKVSRIKAHRYSIEANKILFKKDDDIKIIRKDKDNSSWEELLFWILENGLRLKSTDFDRHIEIKNPENSLIYYEVEMLNSDDYVLSILSERERNVSFDLGAFGISCKHHCGGNKRKFMSMVKEELIKVSDK